MIAAPATPMTARVTMIIQGATENAATAEATANTAAHRTISRRRPIRSPIVPIVIMVPPTMKP
jgi:hypothetical protein